MTVREVLRTLWRDEDGAVVAAEYLMLGSIVTAGSVVGLTAMRDAMVDEYRGLAAQVREVRAAQPGLAPGKPKISPAYTGEVTP